MACKPEKERSAANRTGSNSEKSRNFFKIGDPEFAEWKKHVFLPSRKGNYQWIGSSAG
jgi:hypothetical protein